MTEKITETIMKALMEQANDLDDEPRCTVERIAPESRFVKINGIVDVEHIAKAVSSALTRSTEGG